MACHCIYSHLQNQLRNRLRQRSPMYLFRVYPHCLFIPPIPYEYVYRERYFLQQPLSTYTHTHPLIHCLSLSFTPSDLHFPPLPTETNSRFDASMTTYIHDLYLFPNQASQQGCAPIANFGPPPSRSLLGVSTHSSTSFPHLATLSVLVYHDAHSLLSLPLLLTMPL